MNCLGLDAPKRNVWAAMSTCVTRALNPTTRYQNLTGSTCHAAGSEEETVDLSVSDLTSGMECILEYNTTQRVSKLGTRERHIKVLRTGMLSETPYYKSRYGDQAGVWVEDRSDGGKEKFFVFSRIKSIRTICLDDLL